MFKDQCFGIKFLIQPRVHYREIQTGIGNDEHQFGQISLILNRL